MSEHLTDAEVISFGFMKKSEGVRALLKEIVAMRQRISRLESERPQKAPAHPE